MWPWEHLAFGYLLYSLTVHLRSGRAPASSPVFVLVLATQLPDLIDKPLAWGVGVLPHGLSLAHSLLFAVPFLLGCLITADLVGVAEYGVALTVGYLSHLVGDVIYGFLVGGDFNTGFLFWPFVEQSGESSVGLLIRTRELVDSFLAFLTTPIGRVYLGAELLALSLTAVLWIYDGLPGVTLFPDTAEDTGN